MAPRERPRDRESPLGREENRPERGRPMIPGRAAGRPTIREATHLVEIPAEEGADDRSASPRRYMSPPSFLKMRTFIVPSVVT